MSIELNEVTAKLPPHLHRYIVRQPYESYTPTNQAVWRYVMRLNIDKLRAVAHESYLKGLKQTGISIDEIPHMEGMNRILKEIGWAAVSVDGFIPPSAFMEFQAYNVLVIAADMRTLEHIGYTPAPDIIHESAGHAPIIANPEYAEYLRRFGQIGSKAIASKHDGEVYEAIRVLSQIKEQHNADPDQVLNAENRVKELQEKKVKPSELAQIRNLHWWTVEYGLIGDIDDPKIYGAGLLSSIEESVYCLSKEVKKIPYSINAAKQSFDITRPQPQLFVTPNFAQLSYVLEEFANKMGLRKGGLSGLRKLIESEQIGSVELSTGLQITGVFSNCLVDDSDNLSYVQLSSPVALSYRDKELIGHSKKYHADGFGSPIGKLKDSNLAIEDMSPKDLERYGIYEGKKVKLEFEGGVVVEGDIITGTRNLQGKIMLISFKNCSVYRNDEILFRPEWGIYDMAVGKSVVSAFGGAADPVYYDPVEVIYEEGVKAEGYNWDANDRLLDKIKQIRITKNYSDIDHLELNEGTSWIALLELKELMVSSGKLNAYAQELFEKAMIGPHAKLIRQGLDLLETTNVS
ncbi:MAG: aromatic amino acid hydroxylase [Flavobacteriaceae bacterium]